MPPEYTLVGFFVGEAMKAAPEVIQTVAIPGGEGRFGYELDTGRLAKAIGSRPPLAALLARVWHESVSSPSCPPEALPHGSWEQLLFALVELRLAGREDGPLTRELMESAADPPGEGRPAVPEGLGLAAAALADASRAMRAVRGVSWNSRAEFLWALGLTDDAGVELNGVGPSEAFVSCEPLEAREKGKGCREIKADGWFAGEPRVYFATALGARSLWKAAERGLESCRKALKSLSANSAGRLVGLDEAVGLPVEAFAGACLERSRDWAEAARACHAEALDSFCAMKDLVHAETLAEVTRIMDSIAEALGGSGARKDAAVALDLAGELRKLADGPSGWEAKVPLAHELMKALKSPGPLTDEELAPLEYDFSPAFHRRLRGGEFRRLLPVSASPEAAVGHAPGAEAADTEGDAEKGDDADTDGLKDKTALDVADNAADSPGGSRATPEPSSGGADGYIVVGAGALPRGVGDSLTDGAEVSLIGGAADSLADGASDALTGGAAENLIDGAADSPAEGAVDSSADGVAYGLAGGASGGLADGAAEDVAYAAEDDLAGGAADGLAAGTADGLAGGAADSFLLYGDDGLSDGDSDGPVEPLATISGVSEQAVRERLEAFRKSLIVSEGGQAANGEAAIAVAGLLDEGETAAASDLLTEAFHRMLTGMSPVRLPAGLPDCPAEEFFGLLPKLIAAGDPFDAAAEGRPCPKGELGARTTAVAQSRRAWRGLCHAFSPGAGEAEASAALEKLLIWLGLGGGKGLSAASGGVSYRTYSARTSFEPPLPAWGEGRLESLALMGWRRDVGNSVGPGKAGDRLAGLAAALDAWKPSRGAVPLAVSLFPLTPEDRGRLYGWARRAGRDLALLDEPLMAAMACAAGAEKSRRAGWLFEAGGVYGAFDPFAPEALAARSPDPAEPGAARRISEAAGIVRVEGPAGVGKSELARLLCRLPAASDGDWACLLDWREDVRSAEALEHGPLGALLRKAAGRLDLPGWDFALGAAENVRRLEGDRGRDGIPDRVEIIVDGADGLVNWLFRHPGDLALFREIAMRRGALKLVLLGRRLSRRLEGHPASPFAVLNPAVRLEWPHVDWLFRRLAGPLASMGCVFEGTGAAYRALAASFWNPGALDALARGIGREAMRLAPRGSPPPFKVTGEAVDRAASDKGIAARLKELALAPLEDPLVGALASTVAWVGGAEDGGAAAGAMAVGKALEGFWPEAFADLEEEELRAFADDARFSGLLARDAPRSARVRSVARFRLAGGLAGATEALACLKGLPAPSDARLMSARRLLTQEDPIDSAPERFKVGGPAGISPAERWEATGRAGGYAEALAPYRDLLDEGGFPGLWAAPLLGLDGPWGRSPDRCAGPPKGGRRGSAKARALPDPSPLTLFQEAALFTRSRTVFARFVGSRSCGAERAGKAIGGLTVMDDLGEASRSSYIRIHLDDAELTSDELVALAEAIGAGPAASRQNTIVADALTDRDWDEGGSADCFQLLRDFSKEMASRLKASYGFVYLCLPDDMLLRQGRSSPDQPIVSPPRWTARAVALYLEQCGLDPALAGEIMDDTGGWDSLVLDRAWKLAGLKRQSPEPETPGYGAPLELEELIDDLHDRGPATLTELESESGMYEVDGMRIGNLAELLLHLSVLVPVGERDGELLLKLDPRFE
jgi:hypothetical protein